MLNWIRRTVPGSLKSPLKKALGLQQTRLHADWSILLPIGPIYREHVVLDVGAHHGWFFHCWQDWCPDAHVHAFEPYPESFEAMRKVYGSDPRVTLNRVGIGDAPNLLALQVMAESKVSNSFLAHRGEAWEEIKYRTGTISSVEVPVTTLDAYTSEEGIDGVYLLKIDVQGYELKALHGARKLLPVVDHIFVESGIRPLYEGAARFTEVIEFLQGEGFHLMAQRAWHRGNHVLVETDMLFRRNALAPAVDESVVRVFEE
jgi:FkbM family methyltransferase